jgi:hypothetical protein
MNRGQLAQEIVETYKRHGWRPRRWLLRPESRSEIEATIDTATLEIREAAFDAIWFSRPSFKDREAWELRLLEETPYALFETFAADLPEEEREALRTELEDRLRERIKRTTTE